MVSGAAGGVTGVARTVGELIKAAAGKLRVVITVVITVVVIVVIIVVVIIVIVIVVVIGVGVVVAIALAAVAGPGEVVVLGFDRRLEEGRR
jgi:hypothetical protein